MDQVTKMETRLAEPAPQESTLAQSGSNVLRRHIKENPKKAALARHRLWLDSIPYEYPMPYTPYKIGVYIRYFNQTRHENYLEKHIQQYMDDIALCPQWTLVDFYVDRGMTAPHMEYSKEWCRLLEDCFTGKVDLIVTQKVSNVSSDWKEMSFMRCVSGAGRIIPSVSRARYFWTVSARWHRRSEHRTPACCTEGC